LRKKNLHSLAQRKPRGGGALTILGSSGGTGLSLGLSKEERGNRQFLDLGEPQKMEDKRK